MTNISSTTPSNQTDCPDVTATEPVVGVLGGMGPEATVDLMSRIIRLTPASDDIDHVRCIVDQNPKVPSRIKALIEGNGTNPGPCMADMGRRLENWGADFLVIPCNTAHYYYNYVRDAVNIPVVHLLDLTVQTVIENEPGITKVGLLASTAVLNTEMYLTRFRERGVEVVYPRPMLQEQLLRVIKDVKAGRTDSDVRAAFHEVAEDLKEQGAPAAIIACTELSVIGDNMPVKVYDAADLLAREIVAVAKHGKKPFSA